MDDFNQAFFDKIDEIDNKISKDIDFKTIINDFPGCRIGIPRIGAGYAGGDWEKIKNIIKDELNQNNNDVEITVVEI